MYVWAPWLYGKNFQRLAPLETEFHIFHFIPKTYSSRLLLNKKYNKTILHGF